MSVLTGMCGRFYSFGADVGLNAVLRYEMMALLASYRNYPLVQKNYLICRTILAI